MTNWKEYKLGEIADVRDGTHDSPKQKPVGKPLVTSKHIKGGRIDLSSTYLISLEDFVKINKRSKVDKWDILFSMIGTIGEMVIVRDNNDFAIKNVGLFKTGDEYLSQWIYYYFKSPNAQKEIVASLKGSTQQYISLTDLRNFPISLPPEKIGRSIIEILSSLDDKIALNNKINQELENLAQTLFKQWFIDFEFPNENGEPYKSSGGEMIDSELGEIPSNWKVERLGDHLYIKGRIGWKGLKKSEYLQEFNGYSIVNGSDFLNEQINYSSCGWIPKDRYNDSPEIQLKESDILITKDGTIGKLAFVNKVESPTSVASGIFVVRAASEKVSTFFCWSFFKSPYFQKLVKSRIDGSVIPHLYQKDFVEMFIPLPPSAILKEYEKQAQSIFELIFENKEESKVLSKLRDTLLPKLISGELEVSELAAEKA